MVKETGRRIQVKRGREGARDLFYPAIKHYSPLLRTFTQNETTTSTVFNALLKRVSIFTLAIDRGTL